MKTTDATVLDEPKIHEPGAEAAIEPAVESRSRRTTGVKDAKIYVDGKFYSEANAKISVFDHDAHHLESDGCSSPAYGTGGNTKTPHDGVGDEAARDWSGRSRYRD